MTKKAENKTPIMVENPKHMKRKTYVFDRGNWLKKTEEIKSGVPQILNPWDQHLEKKSTGICKMASG